MNPWENVALSDYEEHMKLTNVKQLQTLNSIMKKQLESYNIKSVAILGVSGGNGLEHADSTRIGLIYGIDINESYLHECKERYSALEGHLITQRMDIANAEQDLPTVDFLIVNLLLEYIGIDCFIRQIIKNPPKYISCVIQNNNGESFVSDSPYADALADIASIHRDINKISLTASLGKLNYQVICEEEYALPNSKSFIRIDYCK